MTCPKVSIIIPAYNVEAYIEKALESCSNQTYSNIEIVVVDDGSTDHTLAKIKEYIKRDSRFKVFEQENNGVSSARNRALSMASGELCLFLDSDDWLEYNAVEQLVELYRKSDGAFVLCSRYIVDEKSGDRTKTDSRTTNEAYEGESILLHYNQRELCFQSSCYKLFEKAIIDKNEIRFDETLSHGEDGLFVFSYLQNVHAIISSPEPLWNILERQGSATTASFSAKKLTGIMAIEKMMEYELSTYVRVEIEKYYINRVETLIADASRSNPVKYREVISELRRILSKYEKNPIVVHMSIKQKVRFTLSLHCPIVLLYVAFRIHKVLSK